MKLSIGRKSFLDVALVSLGLLLGASLPQACGGGAPEILAVDARIDLRPDKSGSHESLTAFASVRAGDEIEDLESISIACDEAGLSWKLTDTNWTTRKEGGDTWVGGGNLTAADYGPLPRGKYRLIAANLAGQKVEREFQVETGLGLPGLPSLSLFGGEARLQSVWPENYIIAYDGAGGSFAVKEIRNGTNDLKALFGVQQEPRIRAAAVYSYDPQRHIGAYSWRTTRK